MKKILSCGCGNKIIEGVTHYLDLYPENSKERKANPGKIKIPEDCVFIQGDIQNMNMITNKYFDYVYADNVLEHVKYPEAACNELIRVAKAGRIKVPTYFGEIFFGWDYHLWCIVARKNKIWFFNKRIFEHIPFGRFFRERCGKSAKYEDKEIPEISKVFNSNKEIFDITFEWENKFDYEVIR